MLSCHQVRSAHSQAKSLSDVASLVLDRLQKSPSQTSNWPKRVPPQYKPRRSHRSRATSFGNKSNEYLFHRSTRQPLLFNSQRSTNEFLLDPTVSCYEKLQNTDAVLPSLKHRLSRVLFSPGIHYLQDPRSQVFNFDPYLSRIIPNDEFDFDSIAHYVTSSKDETLRSMSRDHGASYYGSTSSMTGVLSHMHFLFSNFRPQSLLEFTKHIRLEYGTFTKGAKLPASVIVKKCGDIYSIDSEKSTDREMILSLMGSSLERMLTQTPEQFEKYRINAETGRSKIVSEREANVYHYAKLENFLMRSQLDCIDERLPGTGTFDLKTRAVSAVRFDVSKVERDSTGYQILKTHGKYESFEREQLELVKSAMLKYGLQARIGDMDGIFMAYHNTVRMFGFEYLPLSKIDEIMHSFGLPDSHDYNMLSFEGDTEGEFEIPDLRSAITSKMADDEFKLSMNLWNKILKEVINELPETSFRFIVKAMKVSDFETKLRVIATPITDKHINELQNIGRDLTARIVEVQKNGESVSQIVEDHADSVVQLNQRIGDGSIGYDVYGKSYIDGRESLARHPIYNRLDSVWKVRSRVVKLPSKEAETSYNEFLEERCNMMRMNSGVKEDDEVDEFVRILRKYSDRGRRLQGDQNRSVVWNDE